MTASSPAVLSASSGDIDRVVEVLSAGGVVIIPTDTFYGLAVDPMNPQAVDRLFRLKERDRGKPLILLVPDFKRASDLIENPSGRDSGLALRLWPGPVTIIFKASGAVPRTATGGLDTIGIRVPSSDPALSILRRWGGPLTAPSANRQGRPAPAGIEDVDPDLLAGVDLLVDCGRLPGKKPSTLVDLTVWPPEIIRPGAVPESRIRAAVEEVAKSTGP